MPSWYTETFDDRVRFGLRVTRIVLREQSAHQLIEIIDTVQMGRVLVLDGVFQTSTADEHLYHEMLVHPAMLACPRPRHVVIVGGGDGGAAREVLRYRSVERVTLVELDGEVVGACRAHMPELGAWDDPRLEVVIGDGAAYVDGAREADVILMDGTDPVGPGAALFGEAFVERVARALATGGVFAQHSTSPLLTPEVFGATLDLVRRHFAHAHPCFGPVPLYAAGLWSWVIASNDADPRCVDRARTDALDGCRYFNADIHRASFAVPQFLRR